MNAPSGAATTAAIPFDQARLDRLMEEANIDVVLATSKHNVQYLLGGYRFIFFSAMDAIGHSRYLPVLAYARGKPEHAAYVGNRMEGGEHAVHPFWTPNIHTVAWGTIDAITAAVEHLKKAGLDKARIGIEPAFLSADAYVALKSLLPEARLVDACPMLERLRAFKTPEELEKLKTASEKITDAMLATFTGVAEGASKREIVQRLREEETARGLQFEYCLITVGPSHNRAVSDETWKRGEVLSLDSGGNYQGYIGDLCRMGVIGEPDTELQDLLAEVEAVQQAAMEKCRAGIKGGDMIAHAESVLKASPNAASTDFFAHGMGLITHEVPFLMTNHPVAYEGVDAERPLQAGMVVSVETTMTHPTRGFIKLEDTVAIEEGGHTLFGDRARGWNVNGG